MSTTPDQKLQDMLESFDVAMLVTQAADGQLRSRPMALADVDNDGTLWFLTQRGSGKLDEIQTDSHVNVAFQSKMQYVSISGTASPVEDRRKVEELWKESWKVWFPKGKDDPSLLLLKVSGATGEYWDNSGASGLKYLIEAGKAYIKGTRPDVDDDSKIHAKVSMS